MSRNLILYTDFAKRKRSTLRPSTAGVTVPVTLKSNTSVVNPTFTLRADLNTKYVYAYAPDWDTYYFVVDKTSLGNGFIELTLTCDPLATLREDIFNTRAFVMYSSSHYDTMVNDPRISQRETRTRLFSPRVSMFTDISTQGSFIITTASLGLGVGSWALNWSNYQTLIEELLQVGDTMWERMQKLFGDALGSIVSARYVPIPLNKVGGDIAPQNIYLGDFLTQAQGKWLGDAGNVEEDIDFNIPWTYSDFRRNSNFTRLFFELPFIGAIDIAPETLFNRTNVTMRVSCNVITGTIAYGIYVGEDTGSRKMLVATYNGSFGVALPTATAQTDVLGAVTSTLKTAENIGFSLATSNPAMLASAGFSAFDAYVSANKTDYSTIGGFNGSYGERIAKDYKMIVNSVDSRTDPSELTALYGRPCAKVYRLGDLSGYVQTQGIAIESATYDELREEAEQLCNSGIYLE